MTDFLVTKLNGITKPKCIMYVFQQLTTTVTLLTQILTLTWQCYMMELAFKQIWVYIYLTGVT